MFEFSILKSKAIYIYMDVSGRKSHLRPAEPGSQRWDLESEFWDLPSDSDVAGLWTGVWETVVWLTRTLRRKDSTFLAQVTQLVHGRTQVAWLWPRIIFRIIGSLLNANAFTPKCIPLLVNMMLWPSLNTRGWKAPWELSRICHHSVIIVPWGYLTREDLSVYHGEE